MYVLYFSFPVNSNELEYEAPIAGLTLATKLQANMISIFSSSQIIVNRVKDTYQAKDRHIRKYLFRVQAIAKVLDYFEITHIPKSEN